MQIWFLCDVGFACQVGVSGPGPPRGFKLFPMAVVRHVNAETAAGGGGVGGETDVRESTTVWNLHLSLTSH